MTPYSWDSNSNPAAIIVEVTDSASFIKLLSKHLNSRYQYHTSIMVSATATGSSCKLIGDGLLGSISEFSVYVIRCVQDTLRYPFIHCFRAPDPLGPANFPLVDITIFRPKKDPSKDRLHIQEVKATRKNPKYFGKCEEDFEGLYAKSRLVSTAEHLKWDLTHANRKRLISRVNDCLGTCPKDSTKVILVPTGVSGDGSNKDKCVKKIKKIVRNLKGKGWSSVRGMYLHVPAIEQTFQDFACGKGCR